MMQTKGQKKYHLSANLFLENKEIKRGKR